MTVVMLKRLLIAAAFAAAAPAAAQDSDWRERSTALSDLARIFGELHHIRRLCEPRYEADIWRERVKKLIELEEPSFDSREQIVKAFNDGYATAQNRFSDCDRRAEDYAAARAADGEALVARLTVPLRNAARGDDAEGVAVWRGGDRQ